MRNGTPRAEFPAESATSCVAASADARGTASERVVLLESALMTLWGEVTAAFITHPTDEKVSAAFLKTDRKLRDLGLLPKLTR